MCYGCYDLAGDIVASQHTAMPAPTPDGMTYHHHTTYDNIPINDPNGSVMNWINPPPDHPYRAKGYQPDQQNGAMPMFMPPAVEARHNGQYVGHLEWTPEGKKVQIVRTEADHRRQGIATAMWDYAKSVEPEVQHSNNRTDLGGKWVDHEQGRTAAWDGTTAEPSQGWKPATTPFIARGINVSHPEDDHDMFHAINEGRATPEHMRRLVTNGGTGNAGVWWGTYSHPDSPDPHAYGNFEDFAIHAGEGANPSESVANYHDSGEYHERTQDRKELGKADSIFAEVPVVMVGKRPKRGDAQWDPELHNPSEALMGNSYLDDDEPVDLHEVHYHNGRDWHTVPMGGHQVTARWQDYHQERQRQEQALDEATGGYDADKADYFARGGQPLITFKDWIKGQGGLQNHNDQAKADFDPNYVHTPDASWGADEAPAWTASLREDWRVASKWYAPDLHLHPDELHSYRNPTNPPLENRKLDKIRSTVGTAGIERPLQLNTDGTHALLDDGHHRLQVAQESGLDSVPVSLMKLHPGYFADDPRAVPIGPGLRQHLGL